MSTKQIRVRRYKGCSAFFVLAFDASLPPKQRFEVLAVFGTKAKAEKIAAELKKEAP
jgi:hypothetical protein